MSEEAVSQLHGMFPQILKSRIRSTLADASGDVETAADRLLSLKTSPNMPKSRSRLQSRVGSTGSKSHGWASIASDARNQDSFSDRHVSYIGSTGTKAVPDLATDYPELPASATQHATTTPPRQWGSRHSSMTATPASGKSPWTSSGEVSPYNRPNNKGVDPTVLAEDLSRRLSFEAERPAYALVVGQDTARLFPDEQLACLSSKFPEIDMEIIRETLVASNGDQHLATSLLSAFSDEKPLPVSQAKSNHHKERIPDIGTDVSEEVKRGFLSGSESFKQLRSPEAKQKPLSKTGSRSGKQKQPQRKNSNCSLDNRNHDRNAQAMQSLEQDKTRRKDSKDAHSRQPNAMESSSEDEASIAAFKGDSYAEDTSDNYHRYRVEALKLDRKRFRRLRNAAHFYALGEHSSAHAALREAKTLKYEAELAHKEAAGQIELANNKGKDSWELDLHGLHLQEANNALDARLSLVEGLKLAPDDRRLLRVIVGRGNHSTGGEAILQRSVHAHLLRKSYKVEMRGGSILIHPKKGRNR